MRISALTKVFHTGLGNKYIEISFIYEACLRGAVYRERTGGSAHDPFHPASKG